MIPTLLARSTTILPPFFQPGSNAPLSPLTFTEVFPRVLERADLVTWLVEANLCDRLSEPKQRARTTNSILDSDLESVTDRCVSPLCWRIQRPGGTKRRHEAAVRVEEPASSRESCSRFGVEHRRRGGDHHFILDSRQTRSLPTTHPRPRPHHRHYHLRQPPRRRRHHPFVSACVSSSPQRSHQSLSWRD